jgi:hypothetical protein
MTPRFHLLVCGTRTFDDAQLLFTTLDNLLREKLRTHDVVIVQGECPTGADLFAREYAEERCLMLPCDYAADWTKHGKAAGPIRNTAMVAVADACVAFWDGKSSGTLDAIAKAKAKGIPTRVVNYKV